MEINYDPSYIIIDNEAAKCMSKRKKDTAGNQHVARRYHYVRQDTLLKEHTFKWISTKFQLADPMTKEGGPAKFQNLWNTFLEDTNENTWRIYQIKEGCWYSQYNRTVKVPLVLIIKIQRSRVDTRNGFKIMSMPELNLWSIHSTCGNYTHNYEL